MSTQNFQKLIPKTQQPRGLRPPILKSRRSNKEKKMSKKVQKDFVDESIFQGIVQFRALGSTYRAVAQGCNQFLLFQKINGNQNYEMISIVNLNKGQKPTARNIFNQYALDYSRSDDRN
jgi:hypothetical protein